MGTKDLQKKMMGRAIELAREGMNKVNGSPFGTVITKGDEIIAATRNEVKSENDCTQHAELRAIQMACKKINSGSLQGCVLFTSCEPCMMCLGAAYWADIDYIYYGASAEDAREYGFIYSDLYYNSNTKDRHTEFKMIQLCRNEAVAVWREKKSEALDAK